MTTASPSPMYHRPLLSILLHERIVSSKTRLVASKGCESLQPTKRGRRGKK